MQILVALVNAYVLVMTGSFLAYVALIVVPFLRHRPGPPGQRADHQWHFMVPCLDEENVVAATVRRLLEQFPLSQVWCIDDASRDATPEIVAALAAIDHRVHAVTRTFPDAQRGKGPALNACWRAIVEWLPPGTPPETVILGVVDADGHLDPRCLDVISGPEFFANPDVSAVQVAVRVRNQAGTKPGLDVPRRRLSRLLTTMQDLEFATVIAAMQFLRRNIGSAGMGGNGQFTRLSALQLVADSYDQPWQDALIEDFELGLHILLTGGRTEYCHDTWVAQQGPPTLRRLVRQRSRWGQGVMQCIRYLRPVMLSPNIQTAAAFEIAYYILLPWFQLVGTLSYVVSLGVLCYAVAAAPAGVSLLWGAGGLWQLLPLFVLFAVVPLALWGPIYRCRAAPEIGLARSLLVGLANVPYSYMHQVAVWWAFLRVVRGRRDWKKTERMEVGAEDLAGLRRRVAIVPPRRLGAAPVVSGRFRPRPVAPGHVVTARLRVSGGDGAEGGRQAAPEAMVGAGGDQLSGAGHHHHPADLAAVGPPPGVRARKEA
ncbi:MAG: glycosyltransferase family 2 protein [Acidimicrobiales bacterium]